LQPIIIQLPPAPIIRTNFLSGIPTFPNDTLMSTTWVRDLMCKLAMRVALKWFCIVFVGSRVAWSGIPDVPQEDASAAFTVAAWQGWQTVAWERQSNYCVLVLTDTAPATPSEHLLYGFGTRDPSRSAILLPRGKRFACVSLESETGRRIEVLKYIRKNRLVCCANVHTLPVNRYRNVLGVKKLLLASAGYKSPDSLRDLPTFREMFGELEPGNYTVHVTFQALEPRTSRKAPDIRVLTFGTVHVPLVVPRTEKRTDADENESATEGQLAARVQRDMSGNTLEVANQSAQMTLPYISVCLMILCTMIIAVRLSR